MRKVLLVVAALVATLIVPVVATTAAQAAIPKPPTPSGLPAAIEPLAYYVGQEECDPVTKPGTAKFARMLMTTYRGTYAGTSYACGTNGPRSEHYDGRSIDWMVSIRVPAQYAVARTVLSWLLATDRAGHKFAMARRLGVQYLIYNNKIWGSWDGRWAAYNNCSRLPQTGNDGTCHRNHLHISLSFNGAMGRVSFWAKRLTSFDYGPCRTRDLNWAATRHLPNYRACQRFGTVQPARTASATKRALVSYSGAGILIGSKGPIVVAVQKALHLPTTGTYTAAMRVTVAVFQRRHRLVPTGTMNVATWRALLAATR